MAHKKAVAGGAGSWGGLLTVADQRQHVLAKAARIASPRGENLSVATKPSTAAFPETNGPAPPAALDIQPAVDKNFRSWSGAHTDNAHGVPQRAFLVMTFFRTRLSAAIAWAMIPLAAWAGMPSTGCVCANGHIKLFCQHSAASSGHDKQHLGCCADEHIADCDHDGDCCGSGDCCHSGESAASRIASKACCKPILTAPIVVPQVVSIPLDQTPAIVAAVHDVGAVVRPAFVAEVDEINTGPPLDRVIVFRSLLI